MTETDLALSGVAHQAELVRDGEVSPRELVELYLERIGRLDPTLNSYRAVLGESARAQAEEAEARRDGDRTPPLLGVPIAVKDNQDVAGELTTQGTGCVDRARRQGLRDDQTAPRSRRDRDRQDEPARARLRDVHGVR